MTGLLLALGAALALDGNETLSLDLAGGAHVEGRFLTVEADALVITGEAGRVAVPLALIEAATRDGQPLPLAQLQVEVAAYREKRAAILADPPPHPRPVTVAGLSLLWSGAGHAALGEWGEFGGYSAAEVVLLGTAALNIAREDLPPAITVLALDAGLRVWAARESAQIARRRRALMEKYGDLPGGDGGSP